MQTSRNLSNIDGSHFDALETQYKHVHWSSKYKHVHRQLYGRMGRGILLQFYFVAVRTLSGFMVLARDLFRVLFLVSKLSWFLKNMVKTIQ